MTSRSRWLAALAVALVLASAACSPDDSGPTPDGSGTTATVSSSPSGYGTRYVLPDGLCDATDLTGLVELYEQETPDGVLRNNSPSRCDTSFATEARDRGLGFSLWVTIIDDTLLAIDPTLARQEFQGRIGAVSSTSALAGVGTEAAWWGDDDQLWIETYDGNLNLRLHVFAVFTGETLPPDMLQRLTAVIQSTLSSLAA